MNKNISDEFEILATLSRQRRSRVAIVQSLYQVIFMENSNLESVIDNIRDFYLIFLPEKKVDRSLNLDFISLQINYVTKHREDIIQSVVKYLKGNWNFAEISEHLQMILLAAVGELSSNLETDAAIIINEYIEIAKLFEDNKKAKFINGVLEKIRRDLRE